MGKEGTKGWKGDRVIYFGSQFGGTDYYDRRGLAVRLALAAAEVQSV